MLRKAMRLRHLRLPKHLRSRLRVGRGFQCPWHAQHRQGARVKFRERHSPIMAEVKRPGTAMSGKRKLTLSPSS